MNVRFNAEDSTEEFSDVVNVATTAREDSTVGMADGHEVPVRPFAMVLKFADESVETVPWAWDLHSLKREDGKDWALYARFISEDGDYNEFGDVVALHTVPLNETKGDYTGETVEGAPDYPPHAVELKLEEGEVERVSNHWDLTHAYINPKIEVVEGAE